MSSRKRLEGVDTIVVVKTATAEPVIEKTYENAEPMPEDVVDPVVEDAEPSQPAKLEEAKPINDEPKVEEPAKVEEPKSDVVAPAPTTI